MNKQETGALLLKLKGGPVAGGAFRLRSGEDRVANVLAKYLPART